MSIKRLTFLLCGFLLSCPCAGAASESFSLPGEGGTLPAVEYPYFPDRQHAFVWRNWTLVPAARLAEVLATSRGEREQAGRFDGTASAARNRTVLERCEGLYYRAAQELASVAVRSVAYPTGTDARGIGMAADRGRLSVCQAGQCQARLPSRCVIGLLTSGRCEERPASIRFWGRSAEKLLPGKNRVSRSSRSSGGPGREAGRTDGDGKSGGAVRPASDLFLFCRIRRSADRSRSVVLSGGAFAAFVGKRDQRHMDSFGAADAGGA